MKLQSKPQINKSREQRQFSSYILEIRDTPDVDIRPSGKKQLPDFGYPHVFDSFMANEEKGVMPRRWQALYENFFKESRFE